MTAGTPLTDEDRWPWLDSIVAWTTRQEEEGHATIITCSALRRVYRDRLRVAPGRTLFVHLAGSHDVLAARIGGREGHFMPASLLPSQVATLEELHPDEPGIVVDIDTTIDGIVDRVIEHLDC